MLFRSRPEDPEFAARWPEEARREILSVRPGITSPASISYHDEEKQLSPDNLMGDYLEKIAPDKMRLDRLYVRHHNLMTDLDAIFWTLIVLVPRVSIQPKSEGQLFGGPFTRLLRPLMNWTVIDFVIALLGAGQKEAAAFDAQEFHAVEGGAQARRVHQPHGQAVEGHV